MTLPAKPVISELSFEMTCNDNSARGVTNPNGTKRVARMKPDIENERRIFDNDKTQSFHFRSSARSAKKLMVYHSLNPDDA